MSILSAALLLFLVFDPLGNIPCFVFILKKVDPKRVKKVLIRELLIGLVILIGFLFGGSHLLKLVGISPPALGIAGGIILLLIAIKMIFHGSDAIFKNEPGGEPFIVPLAVPFIAGPAAMATLMLLVGQAPERQLDWLLALLIGWLGTSVILLGALQLNRILGERVLIAFERLMGMILTCISVEMFIKGIKEVMRQS